MRAWAPGRTKCSAARRPLNSQPTCRAAWAPSGMHRAAAAVGLAKAVCTECCGDQRRGRFRSACRRQRSCLHMRWAHRTQLCVAAARHAGSATRSLMHGCQQACMDSLSMSPVARWHRQFSYLMRGDCVPLPQPGGPAWKGKLNEYESKCPQRHRQNSWLKGTPGHHTQHQEMVVAPLSADALEHATHLTPTHR